MDSPPKPCRALTRNLSKAGALGVSQSLVILHYKWIAYIHLGYASTFPSREVPLLSLPPLETVRAPFNAYGLSPLFGTLIFTLFMSRSWGWVKFSWIRFATYRVLTPLITGVSIRHANLSLSSLSFPPSITRYCFASTTESVDSVRKTSGVISIPWSGICFNSGINGLSMTRIVGD
jgi:hypothetical protein